MTEKSGCRKTQHIRELLANPCSHEDCSRLANHLDRCRECRAEIDSSTGPMDRMIAALRTGRLDNTFVEPALGAVVEQLLAFDPARAAQTERGELLRTLPSSVEWKHSQRAVVTRKMSARSILAVCTGLLAGAFALTELCGVTQVIRSVIQVARGDGMLVIAVDDPEVHVLIDHGTFEISGARSEAIHLRPGKHQVLATRRGIPFRNEDITITRRGKRVLRIKQKPADSASKLIPLREDQRNTIAYVLRLGGQVKILVDWAFVTVTDVRELPSTPFQIESICLSGNRHVGDKDLLPITDRKSIHRLYLARTQITDAALEYVAKFHQLKVLSISTTQITDKGIRHLTALPELDKLDLEYTELTDDGLKRICGLPKLSRLNIKYTRVTDRGMTQVPRLKNLEVLYLAGTSVTDKSIINLTKLTSLRELMLSGTGFTESGIARLESLLPHCSFAVNEKSHLW